MHKLRQRYMYTMQAVLSTARLVTSVSNKVNQKTQSMHTRELLQTALLLQDTNPCKESSKCTPGEVIV